MSRWRKTTQKVSSINSNFLFYFIYLFSCQLILIIDSDDNEERSSDEESLEAYDMAEEEEEEGPIGKKVQPIL